jgi:hypothetical protein
MDFRELKNALNALGINESYEELRKQMIAFDTVREQSSSFFLSLFFQRDLSNLCPEPVKFKSSVHFITTGTQKESRLHFPLQDEPFMYKNEHFTKTGSG